MGYRRDGEICKHSLEMYSTETFESVSLPRSGIEFSASRVTQAVSNVHSRAGMLCITSENLIHDGMRNVHVVDVYQRCCRDKILQVRLS